MDVIRFSAVTCAFLVLIGCNNRQPASTGTSFKKSGIPGCDAQQIPGEYLVYWRNGRVTVEKATDDDQFIDDFIAEHEDEIITSEPHYRIHLEPSVDLGSRDWGGSINWGVEAIEAPSAWGKANLPTDIVVAIIDSGMDLEHVQLQGTVAINEAEEINGLDDDGNGLIDDRYGYDFVKDSHEVVDYTGHGTHIAGVIAGRHDVGEVKGAAPDVKLLPINFINSKGGGSVGDAIKAIRYAAQRKVQVINASWGGEACSSLLREEIENLGNDNILFVTAAGNSGNDISQWPEYPAAFSISNMVTVGASTYDRKTAGFSNFGVLVDLVAPGANIASTYPERFDTKDHQLDGVVVLNGTSMATPYVVAAAALLWSHRPEATYAEIKHALLEGTEKGPYPVKTRGQLNVRRALDLMR